MKQEKTYIAHGIDISDDKTKYDEHAKRVLADKTVLSWIFKVSVAEIRDYSIEQIREMIEGEPKIGSMPVETSAPLKTDVITGSNTVDDSDPVGEITYDVLTYLIIPQGKIEVKIIINVEAQQNYYPGYDLVTRGIYYGARNISSQKNREFTGSNYRDIKKVYSIWVCMNAPEKYRNTITEYSIHRSDIQGTFNEHEQYDLLSVVLIRLGGSPDQYKSDSTQKLLATLFSSELGASEKKQKLEIEFNIPMTRNLDQEVEDMCNLSFGIEEKGIQKGLTQGRKEGLRKQLDMIETIIKNTGRDLSYACAITGISEEEFAELREQLEIDSF